jgi:hypothetical protein
VAAAFAALMQDARFEDGACSVQDMAQLFDVNWILNGSTRCSICAGRVCAAQQQADIWSVQSAKKDHRQMK